MADPARARKIAERVKVIVAEMLETRIKDERLGFVTITDVRMTGDLQHASIFYTVYGTEQERADTEAAMEAARGRIRSAIGKGIGLRLTPSIEFIPDAIPEGAAHVEDLIQVARQRDAEVAAVSAGANYAGEPDPYRRPGDTEQGEAEQLEAEQLEAEQGESDAGGTGQA